MITECSRCNRLFTYEFQGDCIFCKKNEPIPLKLKSWIEDDVREKLNKFRHTSKQLHKKRFSLFVQNSIKSISIESELPESLDVVKRLKFVQAKEVIEILADLTNIELLIMCNSYQIFEYDTCIKIEFENIENLFFYEVCKQKSYIEKYLLKQKNQ